MKLVLDTNAVSALMKGDPRVLERLKHFDAAIAAHALARGEILVTANLDDMARVPGLTVEDWSAP